MYEHGVAQISDEDLREAMIVSSDPDEHVERIRRVEEIGARTVALMNNSAPTRWRRSTSTGAQCCRSWAAQRMKSGPKPPDDYSIVRR
jgi:hypothetical protein